MGHKASCCRPDYCINQLRHSHGARRMGCGGTFSNLFKPRALGNCTVSPLRGWAHTQGYGGWECCLALTMGLSLLHQRASSSSSSFAAMNGPQPGSSIRQCTNSYSEGSTSAMSPVTCKSCLNSGRTQTQCYRHISQSFTTTSSRSPLYQSLLFDNDKINAE